MNRRLFITLGVAVVAVLVLGWFSRTNPRSEVVGKLERLAGTFDVDADDKRRSRLVQLKAAVSDAVAPDVLVRVGDLSGDIQGREELFERLAEALVYVTQFRVQLRGMEVTERGVALEAAFFADAEGRGPEGSIRDSRRIKARFEQVGEHWMLRSADVSVRDDAEPEERP